MTWVNDTLPPRVRRRWLLITIRLSASSCAGTARTLVAVGMVSDRSMFFAITAPAPRIGFTWSVSLIFTKGGWGADGAGGAGAGAGGAGGGLVTVAVAAGALTVFIPTPC